MELFFDTETSGFISKKIALSDRSNAWAVQLAAILSDKDKVYQELNIMIKADERVMNPYAEAVHGISAEMSNIGGVSEVAALDMFAHLLNFNPIKVCHNIDFDFGHIEAMVERNHDNLSDFTRSRYYLNLDSCCTMKATVDFCKLPYAPNKNGVVRAGLKWPKLEELYQVLFNEDFEGAHDALADVRATRRCYYKLKELEVL